MKDEIAEKLSLILHGEIPERISENDISDESERRLAGLINQLIEYIHEICQFIVPLSEGKLQGIRIRPVNFLSSPFKELHSRLLHLTWQAKQVATGDYTQRVDFMGEFSEAFNMMVESLGNHERMLKNKIEELESALAHIKHLEGLLPICSNCKKIRINKTITGKKDEWVPIESYITEKSNVLFTHSICPECMKELYPEIDC